ncbi:MAG: SurA N-terminal domain-containing protein [Spirochaetia bacterium]|jgi:parvulin-like peptidyl-prolyl isomerase|nr:SurA N-terminal domain-containing protein [Spirochaetia bacterium]
MPSKDKKTETEKTTADTKKVTNISAGKAKAERKSIGWIFGMVILILVSLTFVAAPAVEAIVGRKNGAGIKFGEYDGKDISYAPGNYFAKQYENYSKNYSGSSSSSPQLAMFQIWESAFQSTVIYTALSDMAKKAGIITTDTTINEAIKAGGYYNDENGKFDVNAYKNADVSTKESIRASVQENLPSSTVLNDIASGVTSDAEADYVASMSDDTRSFEYVVFSPTSYPDDQATKYAQANPQLFQQIGLSVLSASSKDDAQAALDKINGGEAFATVAKASSKDSYAAEGGKLGIMPYYSILSNFKNSDEATVLLSGSKGSVFGPYETADGGYALYEIDTKATDPDYTDAKILTEIKSYISLKDSSLMDEFLLSKAKEFTDAATTDFDKAAKDEDLKAISVSSTPANIGGSQFMGSFSYSDSGKYLTALSSDADNMKKLFKAKVGSILDPIKYNSSYVVVKVVKEDKASGMGDYIKKAYPYYAGQLMESDLQNAILSDDNPKFKNDFTNVFINEIFSKTNFTNNNASAASGTTENSTAKTDSGSTSTTGTSTTSTEASGK